MQIHTTTRHCELNPEVLRYAQERLEKFGKFARDLQEAHLVVTGEGAYRTSAEITIQLKGREFVGRESSDEAKVAIDLAADRIETQLRRLKEYRVDRRRGRVENGKPDGVPDPRDDEEAQLRALGVDEVDLSLPDAELPPPEAEEDMR